MSGATININALGGSIGNPAALESKMIEIGGGAGLAMDAPLMAQSLRYHGGSKSAVVSRRYLEDDKVLYQSRAVNDWLNLVQGDAANGVIAQAHNEPRIGADNVEAFVKWNVDALRGAHDRRMRLGFGAFAVGNPHESLIKGGAFDPMLKAANEDDALLLHEYFIKDPLIAPETGWLCFRCEEWFERSAIIGGKCKTLVIGEYGRDLGGGRGDGWRGQGWSAEYYASLLKKGLGEYLRLALLYGWRIFLDVYCGGRGYNDDWQSFNIEGEEAIYSMMIDWNKAHPQKETGGGNVVDKYPAGTDPKRMRVNQPNGITLRSSPTKYASKVRVLPVDEVITVYGQPVQPADSYNWQRILTGSDENGWAANYADGRPSWLPIAAPAFVLKMPFRKSIITSHFNDPRDYSQIAPTKLQLHEGFDLIDANAKALMTDPMIHVGAPGKVVQIGYQANGYGNFALIAFANNFRAYYAHMAECYVKTGQQLHDWQIIGLMGDTGFTEGAHVHIALQRIGGGLSGYVVEDVVDPEQYFVAVS